MTELGRFRLAGWAGLLALLLTATVLSVPAQADPSVAGSAGVTTQRVTFSSADTTLVGYVTRPVGSAGQTPGPTIVMAHGLGFTRASGLQPFADRFAAAGARVLSFDYRSFGEATEARAN